MKLYLKNVIKKFYRIQFTDSSTRGGSTDEVRSYAKKASEVRLYSKFYQIKWYQMQSYNILTGFYQR